MVENLRTGDVVTIEKWMNEDNLHLTNILVKLQLLFVVKIVNMYD